MCLHSCLCHRRRTTDWPSLSEAFSSTIDFFTLEENKRANSILVHQVPFDAIKFYAVATRREVRSGEVSQSGAGHVRKLRWASCEHHNVSIFLYLYTSLTNGKATHCVILMWSIDCGDENQTIPKRHRTQFVRNTLCTLRALHLRRYRRRDAGVRPSQTCRLQHSWAFSQSADLVKACMMRCRTLSCNPGSVAGEHCIQLSRLAIPRGGFCRRWNHRV